MKIWNVNFIIMINLVTGIKLGPSNSNNKINFKVVLISKK